MMHFAAYQTTRAPTRTTYRVPKAPTARRHIFSEMKSHETHARKPVAAKHSTNHAKDSRSFNKFCMARG